MPTFQRVFPVMASGLLALGEIPAGEVSIGTIAVGDTPSQVVAKLGEPARTQVASDFLDLHYEYPHLTVSFSEGVVAGLFTDSPSACTPRQLCPGDGLDKMRALHGEPLTAERGTGWYFEYSGHDLYCWLRIPVSESRVESIEVACQP